MKATLKQYRQSPRKVRSVTDLVKGKDINEALRVLHFTPKRASQPILKLINSAVANAHENDGKSRDKLYIKDIRVDQGPTLKRWRARARGRATEIKKRTSHIFVQLEERNDEEDLS